MSYPANDPVYPLLKTTIGSLTYVFVELTVLVSPVTLRLPMMLTLEFNVKFGLNSAPVSVPDAIFAYVMVASVI